jgi:hypothetical protein
MTYLAHFFAGIFVANAIPHLTAGMMGRPFQSPFASPPGKGLSSSTTNVLWGACNAAIGYLLLYQVGAFDPHALDDAAVVAAGALLCAVPLSRHFGRLHGGVLAESIAPATPPID